MHVSNRPNEPMSSYRPHNPGHDYYDAGTYLITLVVTERCPLLGTLCDDIHHPSVALTPTGRIIHEEWNRTETIQQAHGRNISTLCQVCMPDHWHGVITVGEHMDKSLGFIIQSFKSACTARWRREVTGYKESPSLAKQLVHISRGKRRAYYLTRPLIERPLFDDDYDDTICLDERHRRAMIAYVADNPRRAILRRMLPQFMQRRLHVDIDGREYAAFGNLFLLRWARKLQVFCHRRDPATGLPYEQTEAYKHEQQAWIDASMNGATVLVTPGISKGEQLMKTICLERGLPLIHLQKEPMSPYWKPEQSRFDACAGGSLLILVPWELDGMNDVNGVPSATDYSRFHNLNALAESICRFEGEAKILRG